MILMLSAFGIFLALVGMTVGTLVIGGAAGGEVLSAICWLLAGLGLVTFL
jgi:hypothetical protein